MVSFSTCSSSYLNVAQDLAPVLFAVQDRRNTHIYAKLALALTLVYVPGLACCVRTYGVRVPASCALYVYRRPRAAACNQGRGLHARYVYAVY
jgi:hypothetical protein